MTTFILGLIVGGFFGTLFMAMLQSRKNYDERS